MTLLRSRRGSHVPHAGDVGLAAVAEVAIPDDCGASTGAPGERWVVLLDAAKACCSAPPDLSAAPADFVVRAGTCAADAPFSTSEPGLLVNALLQGDYCCSW